MATTWVLKFPQVDTPEQPILVHITQRQGLDLDLLATDGESAYRGKVREKNYAKLRSSNYEGTAEEWSAILRYSLVSKQASGIADDQRRALEVQCSISGKGSKSTLSITLRTRVEDITSRLGVIELSHSKDTDDVDLFGWACQVIDQRDGFEDQVTTNEDVMKRTEGNIASMQKELEDLVTAKDEHEQQMLSKFTLLLNEKKLKVRNQQRVLENAKIDSKKLAQLQLASSGDPDAGTTKKRKRKIGKIAEAVPEDDESDGFDAMDVDSKRTNDVESSANEEGSQGATTATESEDDGDLDEVLQTAPAAMSSKRTAKPQSPPPPPRALPFQKKEKALTGKQTPTETKTANSDANSNDTASEDDEL